MSLVRMAMRLGTLCGVRGSPRPFTVCKPIISVMFPGAGGSRLGHRPALIGKVDQNLGRRTLHLGMNLSMLGGTGSVAVLLLFWLGWTNLDRQGDDWYRVSTNGAKYSKC